MATTGSPGSSREAAERYRQDYEEDSMTATRQENRKGTRKSHDAASSAAEQSATVIKTSKLDLIVSRLNRPGGASLADLVAATGWQGHSIRGALCLLEAKRGM